MAEITKRNLVLTFSTATGKAVALTINSPNEALTDAEISQAMDAIIATNAFGEEELVNDKEEAKYVIQQVEAITL